MQLLARWHITGPSLGWQGECMMLVRVGSFIVIQVSIISVALTLYSFG